MCHSQLNDACTVQHQLEQTFVLGLLVLMNHATKRVLKLVSGNARAAYKFIRFVSMTYAVLSDLTLSVGQREGYAAAKKLLQLSSELFFWRIWPKLAQS